MLDGKEKETFRSELMELGFDAARFTDLSPVASKRLEDWIEQGYHADMDWLRKSIEKRLDPSLVLDGACSVIMLGVNYFPGESGAAKQERWGKYSLYEDYHDTVLKGLKSVGRLLEERFSLEPTDYRYYVDTGPVMERGWAAASGMGWQGKNGMLISKTHGNWLLLATVLTRAPIEPDPPVMKRLQSEPSRAELGALCGKCRACIDICPTSAIVEPGIINANRCISYQTIENKGVIPREMREGIGSRIFGCDICLDVCPWNRFATSGKQLLLSSRYGICELSLLDILTMEIETFREVFRRTPIKRLKLRGLLRNACIVAGNLRFYEEWGDFGDSEWMERVKTALVALARYPEAMVRPHAVWALYRLFGSAAEMALKTCRSVEEDESTLDEYRWWNRAKGTSSAETSRMLR